ncbi:MAG: hypothetical protein WDM71_01895 [Ferruginibacter sp.]
MNTKNRIINTDCVVVISSCDAYADLWRPFFNLFFKYWNDCPFEIILCANFKTFEDKRVKTFLIGEDESWSKGIIKVLESISAPNIILMLEDFFIEASVDTAKILYYLNWVIQNNAMMLRLCTIPGPDLPTANKEIGLIPVGASYRVSTQTSIWNKACILSLINENESIWYFEWSGTKRSYILYKDGFYGVWKTAIHFHHVVERGRWFFWDAKKYKAMDIGCDFERRLIMTKTQGVRWVIKNKAIQLFELLFAPSAREKILEILHSLRRK